MKQELAIKTRRLTSNNHKMGCLSLLGRKSGQAVVEYILIVSISVALIFILKGAFSGMSNFINNYLGLYTECLMAHGELPALGVQEDSLKNHLSSDYKCESGFKPFTIAEGRPPVDRSSGGSQSSQNSSGKSASNADGSSSADAGKPNRKSSNSKDSDAEAAGRSKNASRSSPYGDGSIKRSGRGTADGYANGGDNRSRLIEDDGEGGEEGRRGLSRRRPRESRIIYRDNTRYRAVLGQEAEQIIKQSSRSTIKRKPTTRSIAKADGDNAPGPRSGIMRPPPEKVVAVEEVSDSGWGFGQMIKWLFIIGIIVALIIFFGGQMMNYSNGDS